MTNSLYNGTSWNILYIYSLENLILFIIQVECCKCNNQYMFNFKKNLHDFLYENEYCGKTKYLTPEIFLYVLEKIFIVNLKCFF